jgi:hypothetical protein
MKTGKEVWVTNVPQNVNANPMNYRGKNGKQYVAVIATGQLISYALPWHRYLQGASEQAHCTRQESDQKRTPILNRNVRGLV